MSSAMTEKLSMNYSLFGVNGCKLGWELKLCFKLAPSAKCQVCGTYKKKIMGKKNFGSAYQLCDNPLVK